MKYPSEWIAEVKKEYPDWSKLHQFLDAGSQMVGRYLEDSSLGGFSPERVLQAINSGTIDELKTEAEIRVRRKTLYSQWTALLEAEMEE